MSDGPPFTMTLEDGTVVTSVRYVLCGVEGCLRATHAGNYDGEVECGLLTVQRRTGVEVRETPLCGATRTVDRWYRDGWCVFG